MVILFSLFIVTLAKAQVPVFEVKTDAGISEVEDIGNFYGHGASAADFDGDGDIDFYLCTMNSINDRLYQNNGDGTFSDIAVEKGIDNKGSSRMSLWFDYNADGLLDLVILIERCANFKCGQPILIKLYEQQTNGQFTEVSEQAGLVFGDKYDNIETYSVGGMAAADVNNDNFLDLLVTVWGGKMTFFINNGDGTFTDASESSGLGNTTKYYWQPMFHDFNRDGRIDLFSNIDFGPNEYWQNNGGVQFSEIAGQIGAAVDNSEMGMTIGDFDNDGDFDVYATNITRIFDGRQEHNVLLRNDSEGGFLVFNERASDYNVHLSGWDWGTTFADVNNDGWVDLATTNGWNNDPNWGPDQSHIWMNNMGAFTDISEQSGFSDMLSATTLLSFDIDRDGDLDFLQTLKDNEGTSLPARIYENHIEELPASNHYIVIKPRMNGDNVYAIGTVVKLNTGSLQMMRLISAGTSYFGQEPAEAFFGLGQNNIVDEVEIAWPDGRTSIYGGLAADRVLTLTDDVLANPEIISAQRTPEGIALEWTDPAGDETGFILQRSLDNTFTDADEIILPADQTSYIDPVDDGERLYYRVRTVRNNLYSVYSDHVEVRLVTAIEDLQGNLVVIYPNPADREFFVHLNHNVRGPVWLEIHDSTGRRVRNLRLNSLEGAINVSPNLPAGMYHLVLLAGSDIFHERLIIR